MTLDGLAEVPRDRGERANDACSQRGRDKRLMELKINPLDNHTTRTSTVSTFITSLTQGADYRFGLAHIII